jgi:hypothetical protein
MYTYVYKTLTHTHAHAHKHKHKHTNTQTHKHTHKHAHTHTRRHVHMCIYVTVLTYIYLQDKEESRDRTNQKTRLARALTLYPHEQNYQYLQEYLVREKHRSGMITVGHFYDGFFVERLNCNTLYFVCISFAISQKIFRYSWTQR